jgi:hypothetical protein
MTKLYMMNGPDIGQSFELKDGASYIGRSPDNDIQIADRTVSRRHLRILRRGRQYFITDLESRNGTFFNGSYIAPGLEVEVKEGIPMALGMSVICLGEGCMDQIMPFLDSIEITKETGEQSGIFTENRDKTNQRKLELLYRVSDVLMERLPINETLKKILDLLFDLLKRVDRGTILVIDPDTGDISEAVSRTTQPGTDPETTYCPDVVARVMKDREALVISNTAAEEDDELADTLRVLRIESVLCVPMVTGSQIWGIIYVDSLQRPFGFQKEDVSLFTDLGQRTALAIENALLQANLE